MTFLDTSFLKSNEIYLKLEQTVVSNEAEQLLPAYYFIICLPDGAEVGNCDLRIGHNQRTYYGGNIGYGIKPAYRGRHYAGQACRLLFELAKKHNMEYVLITCNPENTASRRTCEYAGGSLAAIEPLPPDNDMYLNGDRQKCIYRFSL